MLARRSLTVYAAVLGGAVSLYDLWMYRSLNGNWQQSVLDVTGSLILILPGLVLAAGLDGRRYLRTREVSVVAGARPVRALTTALAASAVWPALAMVMLLLTTFAVNARLSEFSNPGVATVAAPFAFIAGYTALAFLLGRHVGVVSLVAAAPVAGYLAPVLLSTTSNQRMGLLTPLDQLGAGPPFVLQTHVVLTQIVVGIVMVAGIIALLALGGRASRRALWPQAAVALVTVGVITAIVAFVDPERYVEVTDADGPKTCRASSALEVCVWTQHSDLLPPVLKVGSKVVTVTGDTWSGSPLGLVEEGLKVPDGWLSFGAGTSSIKEGDAAYTLASVLVASLVCDGDDLWPHLAEDVTDREGWLLVASGYLPVDYASERVQRIRTRPLDQQRSWWAGLREGSVPCS